MKSNVGRKDKSIRLILAMGLALLSAAEWLPEAVNRALIVIAGILLLTGFVRFCPIYKVLGKNTCEIPQKDENK